jgi:flagellar hook assembly protein FlgD
VEILRTISLSANDPNVGPGQTITYTLTAFDFANNESDAAEAIVNTTGVGEGEEIPTVFSIGNNYPNPFNPSTVIRYGVPQQSTVSLKIYNVLGQEIATLVDEVKSAGFFTVQWNGTNQFGSEVASGIYLYLFEAKAVDGSETFKESKKMLLLE